MAATSVDTETAGLETGDAVNVVSFYDSRTPRSFSCVSDNATTKHLHAAIQICQNSRTVVTFNGTGFDFRMIAAQVEHNADKRKCAELALKSYDMMLDFAATNGYYASLNSFANASLGAQKTGDGGSAVSDWENGDHQKVIDYCENDAILTYKVYKHGIDYGRLQRTTKSGTVQTWALEKSLFRSASSALTAHLRHPPNVSWMDNPPDIQNSGKWALDILTSVTDNQ